MVSKLDRGRAVLLSLSGGLLAVGLLASCSRRAEIEDLPDAGEVTVTEPPRPDGGVPEVEDAGLARPAVLACADRDRNPDCGGANDFGCDLDNWVSLLAASCQTATGCRTDGWLEVVVGGDGCASELRMEDPDPDYVACVIEELTRYSCPCMNVVGSRYLGLRNAGCAPSCSTGELRCPIGSTCQNGACEAD